jgi:hypothetical protein
MPKYRIAELLIEINARYPLVARVCEKYQEETDAPADFSVTVTEEEIAAVTAEFPEYSPAYAENYCVCRRVSGEAAKRGVILFHAAAIEMDGRAYAFSAPSGTGKSTHITLWRSRFGKRVGMINGDKPFLREKEGVFTVYGSPWCGKEGWNKNTSAPLAGVTFLYQSKENTIARLETDKALPRVFAQLIKPPTASGVAACLAFADSLIKNVPIYCMGCNISPEAAELAYRTMSGCEPPEKI